MLEFFAKHLHLLDKGVALIFFWCCAVCALAVLRDFSHLDLLGGIAYAVVGAGNAFVGHYWWTEAAHHNKSWYQNYKKRLEELEEGWEEDEQ